MFRRFLIAVLIFLIAVVVVVDRVGALVGAHVLAGKVQTDEHLASRPSASIGGFPFLTQAIGGNYKDVTVTAGNVTVSGVTMTTLTADLHGVHLPFGKVVHGSVSQVPVDRVDGTVYLSFADVNTYLAGKGTSVRVSPGSGGDVKLTERLDVRGKRVTASGLGAVTVSGNVIHVTVTNLTGGSHLAGHAIRFSLPLKGIPFRIDVQTVTASPTGITATGGATNIVLGAHGT